MAGKLVAEEGPLRELVLSFDEGDQWTIGRDPDACQLLVEDPSVSRQHLLCQRVPEGILASNLSHSNPTLINDELLTEPHLLVQDDVIKIGNNTFRYYMETGAQLYEEPNGEHAVGNRIQSATTSEPVIRDTFKDTIFDDDEDVAEKGGNHLAKINFDLLDTGRWLLKVISGPNSGAEFSMQTASSYVIGTDPNTCDIVFYDTSVSRRHARVAVNADDTLSIEDLSSRNGTRVDGETIEGGKRPLAPQTIITIGTTSFVIYDREGEMQTLIAPLLPSIVKVLQKEDSAKTIEPVHAESPAKEAASDFKEAPVPAKANTAPGTFLIVGILIGLFALATLGLSTLFQEPPPVVEENVDTDKLLTEALVPFPAVKYSYNKNAGRVLLLGHVLTAIDRNQLLYNLQNLHFVKDIDDSGMIIDEYVWREANQLLSGNPKWQGINVHSPAAGQYVLTGYLQTRGQGEQVWEYMARNFPYIDMLENKIVIEEDVLNTVSAALRDKGLNNVSPQVSAGELSLTGTVPADKFPVLEQVVTALKEMPGIRLVKNFVTESAHQESIVNISDRYLVSGSSLLDGKLSVIINGRILSQGDSLDGMTITNIQSNYIILEKDGVTYRIDYSK